MSVRLSSVCFAGLLLSCAALMGVACSSDSTKKVAPKGEGGAAGESAGGAPAGGTAPTGGAGAPSEAGQGGAPVVGAAGAPPAAAGAPAEAGAGGASGAAGAPALACTPIGTTGLLALNTENQQTVCRGALVTTGFTGNADSTFSCCGVSNTPTPYSVDVGGASLDGSGSLALFVPSDAPYGVQSITVTCSSGAATNTFDINVSDANVLPTVSVVTAPTSATDLLVTIDGTGLGGVTVVTAVSVDNPNNTYDCSIESHTQDSQVTCYLPSNGVPAGDYTLTVTTPYCGSAYPAPTLTMPVFPTL